jgi:hypothetical protein
MKYEYSVFTIDGQEHVRYAPSNDTEEVMILVLKEFDESQIDTVTCKIEPTKKG